MRAFGSCHEKAMNLWRRVTQVQYRALSDLAIRGKAEPGKLRSSSKSEGPLVFSGIQPTGIPHLGNYLGALRPWVELQNGRTDRHRCIYCVVDLHALTVPHNVEHLAQWRKESFASLMAIGLDPMKSAIFMQSDLTQHSELMWILSTVASTGQLSRMTQWKSKLELPGNSSLEETKARAKLKLGLFSYPVLQAADILLHQAELVPVGEDQIQHVEFARDLAKSFNHVYGDVFTLPKPVPSPAKRIMSLKEPQLKMSKSHADPKSRILITDSEDDIKTKIKEALTDSESGITYDPNRRPGVANLLEILKHTTNSSSSCEELAKDLSSLTMRQLKDHVSQAVVKCLSGIRESYEDLMLPSNSDITQARKKGRRLTSGRAGQTLKRVREHIGISDAQWPKIREGDPSSRLVTRKQYGTFSGPGKAEEVVAQLKPSTSYVRLDMKMS